MRFRLLLPAALPALVLLAFQPAPAEDKGGFTQLFNGRDFAGFAETKLSMPMLVLSGEKAGGQFLIDQGRMVDDNVEGVIVQGSGHWLINEAPEQVIPKLLAFLNP